MWSLSAVNLRPVQDTDHGVPTGHVNDYGSLPAEHANAGARRLGRGVDFVVAGLVERVICPSAVESPQNVRFRTNMGPASMYTGERGKTPKYRSS